ncbi:family 5 extracellular solute-binding protein [Neobacillus bataviensis LMG 21833]|uniref:Family 5 extracellular solute-binding protein n=1 Tax=Neobacillus bataviensis LMG 21833 TaxID=1117379 RepID=K6DHQ2_9BACI|nr:ABC transporter substrate-binding protein [Neobacillus bataviensis]EKN67633.1 family 5 extracellular solute-binding protein [Neobacillus bataviensis LMG 21833]
MKNARIKFLTILSILMLLFLSACSGADETSSSSKDKEKGNASAGLGDTIVVGVSNAIGSLNPINARDLGAMTLSSILFDPLFEPNEKMEFQFKLAESFETKDNQAFTIKINPKANWTDGKPVTTEDVKFTFETIANPVAQSVGLKTLNIIEGLDDNGQLLKGEKTVKGIEIVDDKTFIIHTKQPTDPNYIKGNLINFRIIPSHILKDKDLATLHQDPFMLKPTVSNGAYTLVDFKGETQVEFKANPNYYRGAPKTEKLFFKVIPQANITAQLQTGEIHMNYPAVGAVAIQDIEKVKNMANVEAIDGKGYDYQEIYMNTKTFTDPKMRQAIAYAINRPQIVEKLLKGKAEIIDGPYTKLHPYYNKDIKNYEYDLTKAKKLIEESGWDKNKPIRVNVPVGNQVREQSAVIIAENLKAVGLNVQIQKFDFPTHMQKGAKHDFDLMFLGIPYQIDPDLSAFYGTNGPYNFADYSNPEVDELIMKGKSEPNPENRKVIYDKIQEILHEDLPTISLYSDYLMGAVSKKVKVGLPRQFGMFYDVQDWVVEK